MLMEKLASTAADCVYEEASLPIPYEYKVSPCNFLSSSLLSSLLLYPPPPPFPFPCFLQAFSSPSIHRATSEDAKMAKAR